MRARLKLSSLSIVLLIFTLGCAKSRPTISKIQPEAIAKEIFQGEWYFARTIIDLDYEARSYTFVGDITKSKELNTIERIVWIIDKEYLYAYRTYELVAGANPRPKGHLGGVVAAFKILSHFDITQEYHPKTGEKINIIREDTKERPWYERKYIRVDFSQNLVSGYYWTSLDAFEIDKRIKKEPAPFFVKEGSPLAKELRLEFHYATDKQNRYPKGTMYYMSFVTQEIWTPDTLLCFQNLQIPCSAHTITIRNSFLKVPKKEYKPLEVPDTAWDRFGIIRIIRPTYLRGDRPDKTEGLTRELGETDFVKYLGVRHDIFKEYWQKDEKGNFIRNQKGRLIPIPIKERSIEPIVYILSPGFPPHLIRPAFEIVASWNKVFMDMMRIIKGEPLPSLPYQPFKSPPELNKDKYYDCYIEGPEDPSRPKEIADFKEAYQLKFKGKECILILKVNSCDLVDNRGKNLNLPCEKLGDLRYNFLAYVNTAGTEFCGVSTPLSDPLTGKIIAANSLVLGDCIDRITTRAKEEIRLLQGKKGESDIFSGEDIRRYLQNLGYVEHPPKPVVPGTISESRDKTLLQLKQALLPILKRSQRLKGMEGKLKTFSERLKTLRETPLELQLLSSKDMLAGMMKEIPKDLNLVSSEILDKVSPFRVSFPELLIKVWAKSFKMAKNFMAPLEWIDHSLESFIRDLILKDLSSSELTFLLNRRIFSQIMLHEMGHSLGLEHNFAASTDRENYAPEYYKIASLYPWPKRSEFREEEYIEEELKKAREKIRKARELLGISRYATSSVMDYFPEWYQGNEVGSWDKAAIMFAYGGLVEAYKGDPRIGGEFKEIRPDLKERVFWRYYVGGEPCSTDKDCPYSKGSEWLMPGQKITQRCGVNPRPKVSQKVCQGFDKDFDDWLDEWKEVEDEPPSLKIKWDANSDGEIDFYPRRYKFCPLDRVRDISWCNMFDQGASFREIVTNFHKLMEKRYIWWNFRRARRNYRGYIPWFIYQTLGKIYQHMVFRINYEPGYLDVRKEREVPFKFMDQYLASVDAINLFATIIAQPDVGSYKLDPEERIYRKVSNEVNLKDAHLSIELGMGKYLWSAYQDGYYGFYRLERQGFHLNKLYALMALSTRDWGLPFRLDERFLINFYDLFPTEVSQIFAGLILDDPKWYSARIKIKNNVPYVFYQDLFRGGYLELVFGIPYRDPMEIYEEFPAIDDGGSEVLRNWAAIFGLALFPVYFDTTFEEQLFLCIEGEKDCPLPPQGAIEGVDFMKYTVASTGLTYVAIELTEEQRRDRPPPRRSISIEMLRRAQNIKRQIETLTQRLSEIPSHEHEFIKELQDKKNRLELKLSKLENFLSALIYYTKIFGIYSF